MIPFGNRVSSFISILPSANVPTTERPLVAPKSKARKVYFSIVSKVSDRINYKYKHFCIFHTINRAIYSKVYTRAKQFPAPGEKNQRISDRKWKNSNFYLPLSFRKT